MTSCVCHISINSEASHRQPALINSLINFLLKEMHDYIRGGQCWLQDKLIWVFRAGRYPAHMSDKAQSHLEAGSDFTPREQQPCHLKLPLQPVSRENIYTRQKCILLLFIRFLFTYKSVMIFVMLYFESSYGKLYSYSGWLVHGMVGIQSSKLISLLLPVSSSSQHGAKKRGAPVGSILFLPPLPLFDFFFLSHSALCDF